MEHENTEHHNEHHAEHHKVIPVKKSVPKKWIVIGLASILLLILLFNQFLLFTLNQTISQKLDAEKDALRPASIKLTSISDESCSDCHSMQSIIDSIKGINVNVTQEKSIDYSSEEAKSLIETYGIKKVPTVLITGEIDKITLAGFEKSNDGLVFTKISPPYKSITDNKIVGRVAMTIINSSSCTKCYDMKTLASQIELAGVPISSEKVVDITSKEGSELVKKYNITKVPTMLLSQDAFEYEIISGAWPQIGTVESDGMLVMRQINPPYYDVSSKEIKGLVSVTMLNDSTCKECYNVTDHLTILKLGFAIDPDTTKTFDISSAEGKNLITKYNITAVPTVLIYNADAYESLKPSWGAVGSIEKDGTYIFRNFEQWKGNPYKDLTTGKVVLNPAQ